MSDIVQKLWGFCHTLRHDGVDYGDYIEQLKYLHFLKMADEREIDLTKITWQDEKGKNIADCSWPTLESKSGTALTDHYAELLRILRQTTRAVRRNLHAGHTAVDQSCEPQAPHRHDRR